MEMFASECCGTVFVPGHGPDNIHEQENSPYEAERDGECPSCGKLNPNMTLVFKKN